MDPSSSPARWRSALLCLTALCLPLRAFAADSRVERLRENVRIASDSGQLQTALSNLVAGTDASDRVRILKNDKSDTIAIRGAWEAVRETLPGRPPQRQNEYRAPNVTALARFLGFMEGRLGLSVPPWWEDCVMGAKGNEGSQWHMGASDAILYDRGTLPRLLYPDAADGALPISRFFTVNAVDGQLVLRSMLGLKKLKTGANNDGPGQSEDAPTCKLPPEIARSVASGVRSLNCYMDARVCLVAATDLFAQQYDLYCIDCRTSQPLWKSAVWAGHATFAGLSGQGYRHSCSIHVEDERVFVFGRDSFGAYFELFSLEDGKALVRFSTSY